MRMVSIGALLLAIGSMAFVSCTGIPQGLSPVTGFQLDRYLGTWYEIARLDHSFERGLERITATYGLRDDGGVQVLNKGYRPSTMEWDSAVGRAYFTDDPSIGSLKVSFFWPFYGGYNIIALDHESYQYAMVCGPTRSYLWILARSPELDSAVVQRLVETARTSGFLVDDLIWVSHEPRHTE